MPTCGRILEAGCLGVCSCVLFVIGVPICIIGLAMIAYANNHVYYDGSTQEYVGYVMAGGGGCAVAVGIFLCCRICRSTPQGGVVIQQPVTSITTVTQTNTGYTPIPVYPSTPVPPNPAQGIQYPPTGGTHQPPAPGVYPPPQGAGYPLTQAGPYPPTGGTNQPAPHHMSSMPLPPTNPNYAEKVFTAPMPSAPPAYEELEK